MLEPQQRQYHLITWEFLNSCKQRKHLFNVHLSVYSIAKVYLEAPEPLQLFKSICSGPVSQKSFGLVSLLLSVFGRGSYSSHNTSPKPDLCRFLSFPVHPFGDEVSAEPRRCNFALFLNASHPALFVYSEARISSGFNPSGRPSREHS